MKAFFSCYFIAVLFFTGCEKGEVKPRCTCTSPDCTGVICADLYHSTSCDASACMGHGEVDHWLCE